MSADITVTVTQWQILKGRNNIITTYSNPGLFRTLLALTRSSQLSLAMASRVCAAAKNKFRRMIWRSIEMNLLLFLSCLVEMLGEK